MLIDIWHNTATTRTWSASETRQYKQQAPTSSITNTPHCKK